MKKFKLFLKSYSVATRNVSELQTINIDADSKANAEAVARRRLKNRKLKLRTFSWIETNDNQKAMLAIVLSET